jgi:DNA-binding transcriptional MerR regulator
MGNRSRTMFFITDDEFEEFEIEVDEPIFTTGVICKLLDIPVHVLKQLDDEEIVKPLRKKGKARLYSKRELSKLQKCWFYMRERRVKVHGLKVILEMEEDRQE